MQRAQRRLPVRLWRVGRIRRLGEGRWDLQWAVGGEQPARWPWLMLAPRSLPPPAGSSRDRDGQNSLCLRTSTSCSSRATYRGPRGTQAGLWLSWTRTRRRSLRCSWGRAAWSSATRVSLPGSCVEVTSSKIRGFLCVRKSQPAAGGVTSLTPVVTHWGGSRVAGWGGGRAPHLQHLL